jgi:hypothetical protein
MMSKATCVEMEELGVVPTVCRNGRTMRIVMHTVRRNGGHVGNVEFGNIAIGAHGAVGRRGECIGDRCISGGGGQPLGGDLYTSGGALIVVSHCAVQGDVSVEDNDTIGRLVERALFYGSYAVRQECLAI